MSEPQDERDSADAPIGYWEDAARPLTSLLFVLPLLVVYEIGLITSGGAAARNAADIWLRGPLEWFGFGHYVVLPVATAALLLAWHHLARYPWRVSLGTLPLMVVETLLWAALLAGLAKGLAMLLAGTATPLDTDPGPLAAARSLFSQIVAFIGAGIYEELLFRMLLLPAVAGLLHLTGMPRSTSYAAAAGLTALGFALAHYLPGGETFVWNETLAWHRLIFRTLAGGVFAGLFLWRGFGIAAGTHVVYDIFTLWL